MHKIIKKKMYFTLQLIIHLAVQSRGVPEGALNGAPKDALSDLHKNAKEGAFEVARKGAFEVTVKLHLWLHLLVQSLVHKCLQNGSYNGGPDPALEGTLDVGLNIRLEWTP